MNDAPSFGPVDKWTAYVEGGWRERETIFDSMANMSVAVHKTGKSTDILLEGQQQGDHKHKTMGVYELMEGKEVNGRGVWQMEGGVESGMYMFFMYYAKRDTPDDKRWHWWIGGRAGMEAGEGVGGVKVASSALTPDQVTETWQVGDGTGWPDAPKVRARRA
jgi:hypothetical protein